MVSGESNGEFTANDVPGGNPRVLGGIAIFSAVLVMALSLFFVARIHDSVKGELQSLLTQTLTQTTENLRKWETERRRNLELWATTPDVVALTEKMAAAGGSVPQRLHLEFSKVLISALKAWDGYAYAVVGVDGQTLTSSETEEVGLPSVVVQIPGFMKTILAGGSVASRPMHHPEIKGHNLEAARGHLALVMYVGAPIKDNADNIIGALVFELDPTVDFSLLLSGGRGRTTMETFAFNADGLLLSESRFNDTLSKIGLIGDGEYSILNVAMRDPGGDLRNGYHSAQLRESQPLTRVVQNALKGGAGVDLDGYRSYMGHEVIGAWLWDDRLGFGLATEMQSDEAFATYSTTRWEILGASGLAALLLIGLAVSFRSSCARASESALRIQAILANVLDAIILIDERGIIKTFNPAAERVFGYSAHEVIGENVKIFMSEPHRSGHDGYLANFLNGGDPKIIGVSRELQAERKDGSFFPIELRVTEMQVSGRRMFLGTVRDITERQNAEAELQRSSESLKTAQRIAKLGGWSWDIATGALAWSDEIFRIFGHSPQEFPPTYEGFLTAVHPEDRDMVQAAVGAALENKSTYSIEHRIVQPNGQVRTVHEQGEVSVDADGAPTRMDGIIHDITERKAAERIKSEFVSTVSHELRTPLTSIHGSLGLLSGGAVGEISDQGKQLIQVALQNSEILVHLIDDILDVEKLETGKMIYDLCDMGVADLLTRAMDTNSAYADKYGVTLTCVDDAPKARIMVDANRFAQVIANLISNAVKFSPKGESVAITAGLCDTGVRFSVTDHGPGVPQDFYDQIFQHFTQADGSDTRQKGGTGLGLTISKATVEDMRGTIGFTSEEGGGATFFFIIPQV